MSLSKTKILAASRILTGAALALACLMPCVQAWALDEAALVEAVERAYNPPPRQPSAVEHPSDPITTLNLRVIAAWDQLSPAARQAIGPYIQVELDPETGNKKIRYPQFEKVASDMESSASNAKFTVHYTTEDMENAPPLVDVSPQNGVPDYVDLVLDSLAYAYQLEVTEIGFDAPPFENDADHYQVYLATLDPGVLGYTMGFECGISTCDTFMVLENDYAEILTYYPHYTAETLVQATTAHEFQHMIQLGSYQTFFNWGDEDAIWLLEAGAVWMAERAYPDQNLYVEDYLTTWFNHPEISLDVFSDEDYDPLHAYGSSIFFIFLWEKYGGDDTIIRLWEIARDNWFQYSGELLYELAAELGQDFGDMFLEFILANYSKDYIDGDLFPDVALVGEYPSIDDLNIDYFNYRLATRHYRVQTPTVANSFLQVQTEYSELLKFAYIMHKLSGDDVTILPELVDLGDDKYLLNQAIDDRDQYSYTDIIIVNPHYAMVLPYIIQKADTPPAGCLSLEQGWNLVSIPFVPFTTVWLSTATVFESRLERYVVGDDQDFSNGTSPGAGFWIFSAQAGDFCIFSLGSTLPLRVSMTPGWNIVGRPNVAVTSLDLTGVRVYPLGGQDMTLGDALLQSLIDPVVYSYNPATDLYEEYNLNSDVTFDGDKAFWIRADAELELEFQ